MKIALHRLYQRTCKDCGYHWTVTRAQARIKVTAPSLGLRGPLTAGVSRQDIEAAEDAQIELREQFRRCPKCGVDFFSERPVTKRHPADSPEV
jgi:predicted nucleic-acid-binding Zn-ribbon protein